MIYTHASLIPPADEGFIDGRRDASTLLAEFLILSPWRRHGRHAYAAGTVTSGFRAAAADDVADITPPLRQRRLAVTA